MLFSSIAIFVIDFAAHPVPSSLIHRKDQPIHLSALSAVTRPAYPSVTLASPTSLDHLIRQHRDLLPLVINQLPYSSANLHLCFPLPPSARDDSSSDRGSCFLVGARRPPLQPSTPLASSSSSERPHALYLFKQRWSSCSSNDALTSRPASSSSSPTWRRPGLSLSLCSATDPGGALYSETDPDEIDRRPPSPSSLSSFIRRIIGAAPNTAAHLFPVYFLGF